MIGNTGNAADTRKYVGCLFQAWGDLWGLRGDPYLWEELAKLLSKEPLPATVSQLMALIERAFYQLVGSQLTDGSTSFFVDRYNHGGLSGGHVCGEFWRDKVLPELHRRYLTVKYADSTKSPRMIDKPCRYENFPGGCRYGASCRFHHARPISQQFATSGFNSAGISSSLAGSSGMDVPKVPVPASFTPFNNSSVSPTYGSPRSVFDSISEDQNSSKFSLWGSTLSVSTQISRNQFLSDDSKNSFCSFGYGDAKNHTIPSYLMPDDNSDLSHTSLGPFIRGSW
jgi:hypothetical protein